MSSKKRHIRGRVAAFVALSALFMLGLEAPAFAVGPTSTAVSPTSGPDGCVVQITGSGFSSSTGAQTHVFFATAPGTTGGTEATVKTIISDTEIWATSPDLGAGAEFVIRVDNLLGTGTPSTATFLNTSGAGACAPTITSFTPTCGVRGDVVKITGTNLLASGDGTGGLVEFAPYDATVTPPDGLDATPTNPDISDFTTLQVTAPGSTAIPLADGPIAVTTFAASAGGRVLSTTLFQTPPPDCTPATGHTRGITLKLKKSGQASGKVTSTETTPFTACVSAVPVKIQKKKKGGGWKTVKSATTSDTGSYSAKMKGKPGKYRSLAPKVAVGTPPADCVKAKSATRTIK